MMREEYISQHSNLPSFASEPRAASDSAAPPSRRQSTEQRLGHSKQAAKVQEMRLLTELQVSEILATPPGTLRRWRCTGHGPPFIKMGSSPKARVKYDPVDVLAYVEAGRRYPIRAGNTKGQDAWP
jgi:hypothetical protein